MHILFVWVTNKLKKKTEYKQDVVIRIGAPYDVFPLYYSI